MLTFDPEPHVYRWHGKVVPSVTQLLDRLHSFAGVPFEVLEAAKERGSFVHEMCEAFDLGDLDEMAVAGVEDGRFLPYLKAWKQFLYDYRPNWQGIEMRGFSERYRYAGTWDRHGSLDRLPGKWVVDIKSSVQSHRVWGLQTSAYRSLLAELDPQWSLARRATVQLLPGGAYKFLAWDSPADWPTFQALLTLHAWSNE